MHVSTNGNSFNPHNKLKCNVTKAFYEISKTILNTENIFEHNIIKAYMSNFKIMTSKDSNGHEYNIPYIDVNIIF
jgi:hypothetical protein